MPLLQSIYMPEPEETNLNQHNIQQQPHSKTELRFSFTQHANEGSLDSRARVRTYSVQQSGPNNKHPDRLLNRSFSSLSFQQGGNGAEPKSQARTTMEPKTPFVPDLKFPQKHREGFGFSFSDSLFCDPEDYPDTECDWSSETEKDLDSGEQPVPAPKKTNTENIAPDSSFDDYVVVRDVGSFHIAKPQKRLPCTCATQEDTIRVKIAAKSLLKYEESSDIYEQILRRLERMVQKAVQESSGGEAASTIRCALKLQDFLLRTKDGRVDTGEVQRFVEHEIEWATWLVEASRTGVMHVKGPGCKCRPDWEEE
jgi:hypothetical protein